MNAKTKLMLMKSVTMFSLEIIKTTIFWSHALNKVRELLERPEIASQVNFKYDLSKATLDWLVSVKLLTPGEAKRIDILNRKSFMQVCN